MYTIYTIYTLLYIQCNITYLYNMKLYNHYTQNKHVGVLRLNGHLYQICPIQPKPKRNTHFTTTTTTTHSLNKQFYTIYYSLEHNHAAQRSAQHFAPKPFKHKKNALDAAIRFDSTLAWAQCVPFHCVIVLRLNNLMLCAWCVHLCFRVYPCRVSLKTRFNRSTYIPIPLWIQLFKDIA